MAITPNSYLQSDAKIILRDSQTASRLFVDDGFRLAPKLNFLFHVHFSINPAALRNKELNQRHKNEIGMLVKTVDLPNFTVQSETLNQYNRQKVTQYRHKFNDLNITFHDDNMGLINMMWQNYYAYYYADSNAARNPAAYKRNATKGYSSIVSPYGLDNKSTFPFFNYIAIYQMARHEYVGYKLINPVITKWNHNRHDYADSKPHENSMSIAYESVAYSNGFVESGNPEGFAMEHYDVTPSPLSSQGDLPTSSPDFNGVSLLNSLQAIKNLTDTLQTYQSKTPLVQASTGLATSVATSITGTGGLQDTAFPVSRTNNTVIATQVNITQVNVVTQINVTR